MSREDAEEAPLLFVEHPDGLEQAEDATCVQGPPLEPGKDG